MSNPTTPFGWQMPTNTDLVTDLPADFEVFGQAVATSMADLLGGTTGQVLSKATNTNMDFAWVDANPGDITGITATSPLTGGGTSGAVTVGIQASSTTQSGAVQLSDSTSITSSVLAATPTAVKSAYDLAAAAVPKSTVTTAGDVIYATGSSAVTRLGIGSTGQVLTVSGGIPAWASPAGGGKILQVVQGTTSTLTTIASTTFTDSGLSATITPSSTSSRIMVIVSQAATVSRSDSSNWSTWRLVRGSTPIWNNDTTNRRNLAGYGIYNISSSAIKQMYVGNYVDSPSTTSAVTYKTQWANHTTASSASVDCQSENGDSSIILMEIGA